MNMNVSRPSIKIATIPITIPIIAAGDKFVLVGFIGEIHVPVTGTLSLSFPQGDRACI